MCCSLKTTKLLSFMSHMFKNSLGEADKSDQLINKYTDKYSLGKMNKLCKTIFSIY